MEEYLGVGAAAVASPSGGMTNRNAPATKADLTQAVSDLAYFIDPSRATAPKTPAYGVRNKAVMPRVRVNGDDEDIFGAAPSTMRTYGYPAAGAAAGYFFGKKNPMMNAIAGAALGSGAGQLVHGPRQDSYANLGAGAGALAGAHYYKKNRVLGFVAGALAGYFGGKFAAK